MTNVQVPIISQPSCEESVAVSGKGYICESGVESEKEHRSGEPTEGMNEEASVRANLRGLLNTSFLVDPVEKRLDWLTHPAYGL